MKYKLVYKKKFKQGLKLAKKQGKNLKLIEDIIKQLEYGQRLDAKHKQHKLVGNFKDCWECHITPDWLLIWQQNDKELVLLFMDTGTYSDLF